MRKVLLGCAALTLSCSGFAENSSDSYWKNFDVQAGVGTSVAVNDLAVRPFDGGAFDPESTLNRTGILPLAQFDLLYHPNHSPWFFGALTQLNGGFKEGTKANMPTTGSSEFDYAESNWMIDYGVAFGRQINDANKALFSILGASKNYDVNNVSEQTLSGAGFGVALQHNLSKHVLVQMGYRYLSFGRKSFSTSAGATDVFADIKPSDNMVDLALIAEI